MASIPNTHLQLGLCPIIYLHRGTWGPSSIYIGVRAPSFISQDYVPLNLFTQGYAPRHSFYTGVRAPSSILHRVCARLVYFTGLRAPHLFTQGYAPPHPFTGVRAPSASIFSPGYLWGHRCTGVQTLSLFNVSFGFCILGVEATVDQKQTYFYVEIDFPWPENSQTPAGAGGGAPQNPPGLHLCPPPPPSHPITLNLDLTLQGLLAHLSTTVNLT